MTPTRAGLSQLALVRRQEIGGFLEGLFVGEEEADLPAKASAALDGLAQLRPIMAGVYDVAIDECKPATPSDIAATMKRIRELTLAMEMEINRVVLDCTRARRQMLGSVSKRRKPFRDRFPAPASLRGSGGFSKPL